LNMADRMAFCKGKHARGNAKTLNRSGKEKMTLDSNRLPHSISLVMVG